MKRSILLLTAVWLMAVELGAGHVFAAQDQLLLGAFRPVDGRLRRIAATGQSRFRRKERYCGDDQAFCETIHVGSPVFMKDNQNRGSLKIYVAQKLFSDAARLAESTAIRAYNVCRNATRSAISPSSSLSALSRPCPVLCTRSGSSFE